MKNILLILLCSAVILFANVGKITGIKGDVIIKRGGKEIVPNVGFVLEKSDQIITKDKSKVLLLFTDGTSITVGKDSNMQISEYLKDSENPSNNKANFGFNKGVFKSITGKIGKTNPSGFKLETKSASLGIRGSEGLTVVNENGDMKHSTLAGGYYLVDKKTGERFEIPKGNTANMAGGKVTVAVTTTADLKEGEDGLTQKQEDKQEDKQVENQEKENKDNAQNEQTENENGDQNEQADQNENGETTNNDETQTTPADQPEGGDDLGDTNLPDENNQLPENQNLETPDTTIPDIPEVPKLPDEVNEPINTNPTLSVELIETEDGTMSYKLVGVDIDQDSLEYSLSTQPKNGTVQIDQTTRILTYIPNEGYSGTETFDVAVSDGKGGEDIQTITIVVEQIPEVIVDPKPTLSVETYLPDGMINYLIVELDAATKEIVGEDTYNGTPILEYGYLLDTDEITKTATYLTGLLTPTEVIDQYIIDKQTASYSGNIASFVNGIASGGTINLNINFGTQTFSGILKVTQGNWIADINSGTLNSHGFSSSNITSNIESSVTDISGNLNGKYYGPTASSVGGNFNLSSATSGSVNGVFGAKK